MPSDIADLDALVTELRLEQLPGPAERRRIRETAGVSLRRASRVVGVGPMTLYRWETGRSIPRPPHAAAYRQLLDALQSVSQG